MPRFEWTGPLRPSFVTPMRSVPDSILKPDYAVSGIPHGEMRLKSSNARSIPIYSAADVSGIRRACKLGREVLDIAGHVVAPGVTTEEIDIAVHDACLARKCYPSPLNYHNFPKSCCTSVNEVICHGVPDCRPLERGDIVNIDITVYKDGYHGDLNETFIVGEPSDIKPEYLDLIKSTYDATMSAVEHVKPGIMCRKFGEIIDGLVKKEGLSVTRSYCGHGIGKLFHCSPNIPHYRRNKAVGKLKPNMVFTIEPMINMGSWKDKTWDFDHWTAVTVDGKRSAQFEHTVLVTEDGVEILTARTEQSVPLWWDVDPEAANKRRTESKAESKSDDGGGGGNEDAKKQQKKGGKKGQSKGNRRGNAKGRNKGANKNKKRGGRR